MTPFLSFCGNAEAPCSLYVFPIKTIMNGSIFQLHHGLFLNMQSMKIYIRVIWEASKKYRFPVLLLYQDIWR